MFQIIWACLSWGCAIEWTIARKMLSVDTSKGISRVATAAKVFIPSGFVLLWFTHTLSQYIMLHVFFTILYHGVNCKLHITSPYIPSPSLHVSCVQNFSYFLDRKFTIFNRYFPSPQFPCYLSFLTTSLLPIISPSFLVSFPPFLSPSLVFFRSANSYNISALPQLFMTSFILSIYGTKFSHILQIHHLILENIVTTWEITLLFFKAVKQHEQYVSLLF